MSVSSVGNDPNTAAPIQQEAQLRWDDSAMSTSFANVVNIRSTREELDLFFGTNKTWNIPNGDGNTLSIALTNRIILSPYAAKRLATALDGVLREYETRYGAIQV
jgi:hypothetical protein